MKFFAVTIFFAISSAAFFPQCEKNQPNARTNANESPTVKTTSANVQPTATEAAPKPIENMDEIFRQRGKNGALEFEFVGKIQKSGKYEGIVYPNDQIIVEYVVKNTGARDLILYNQGHSDRDDRVIVYAEPQTDGTIELSQKAFREPTDKVCPARYAPVIPRAAWLKAGATAREKVSAELPLKTRTPFADCAPIAEIPPTAKKIKFCLGFQEADAAATKIDENGFVSPAPDITRQQLLCGETTEIKWF